MVRLVDPSQVHLHWTERWHLDYFRKSTVLQCPKIHSGVCWYIRCVKYIMQSFIRNNNPIYFRLLCVGGGSPNDLSCPDDLNIESYLFPFVVRDGW
jgi:hypothetical protein